MNTDYIHEFIILAGTESYVTAAERLRISEPTLSRHIKALEEELGVRLFDRTSRTVKLNRFGALYLEYARQFIGLEEACKQKLQDAVQEKESKATVITSYFINDLLTAFYGHDPHSHIISVVDTYGGTAKTCDMLKNGAYELAFLPGKPSTNGIIALPFTKDEYVAVLPLGHKLANQTNIDLATLKHENFISFSDSGHGAAALQALCQKAGFLPEITFTADRGSDIAACVAQGMGVSILLKNTLAKRQAEGVTLLPFSPPEPLEVYVCHAKTRPLTTSARSLLAFIQGEWQKN